MNEKLFLRNPVDTELGKNIIEKSVILIHKIGFEAFTFKKLALEIGTTEAGIYRYFENKHLLLLYIVDWYWAWQEYRLTVATHNISVPKTKLKKAIELLSTPVIDDLATPYIDEKLLYEIVISEAAKTYLTKLVTDYNEIKLFKPYKDLCEKIANLILENNPKYPYPRSLASSIVEISHAQNYFAIHLPLLTDKHTNKSENLVFKFLLDMIFKVLG